MATRIDLSGGGTIPQHNNLSRLNHLCDGLIEVKKTIVSHENRHPFNLIPTPSPDPDPEPTIFIDPGKITVIRLNSALQRTDDVQYFDTSADTNTYLTQQSKYDRFDVLFGDECGVNQIGIEFRDMNNTDHSGSEVINELYFGTDMKSIGSTAFQNSNSIRIITCTENSVTAIQSSAFHNCKSLERVTFPTSSLAFIGPNAFADTPNFVNVTLPASLMMLDQGCFQISSTITTTSVIPTRNVVFEAGGRYGELPTNAFYNNKIGTLRIPGNVKKIGNYAFKADIDSFEMNPTLGCLHLIIENGVQSVGQEAFKNNQKMETIDLGNTISEIAHSSFNNLRSIASLTIPASLTCDSNDFDMVGYNYYTKGIPVEIIMNHSESTYTGDISAWTNNSEWYHVTWNG